MHKTHFAALLVTIISLTFNKVNAQQTSTTNTVSSIEAKVIFITTNKTTSLVFPIAIRSVDRGSQDVLARQVEEADNILQLKAGKENFQETNLTVITADGNLYSFQLNYKASPAELVFKFSEDSIEHSSNGQGIKVVRFKSKASTDAEIVSTGNEVLKIKKRIVYGVRDRRYNMKIKLRGVYTKSDVLYFQLECTNLSNINFDVEMFRFYIRDQFRAKRTAVQEVEIKPYSFFGNRATFKAESSELFVVAIPKFTIPFAKYFTIAINEKNGGRNLHLNIRGHAIVEAKRLAE